MEEFIKNMPKLELHAHLNGSISTSTLLELGQMVYGETTDEFRNLCDSFKRLENPLLAECFEKFKIAHDLTVTKEALTLATLSVIKDFKEDNVIYLELRTTPRTTKHMTKQEYMDTVVDAVIMASVKYPDICIKLVPSIDRSKGKENAREAFNAIKYAYRFHPEIIVGIDFCGDPYIGDFRDFWDIFAEARAMGLHLAFHCAEIKNDAEARFMVDFGMERCGHGTYMPEDLLQLVLDEEVTVECCLTSNVKCGTVGCYADHHFKDLFRKHVVALCTDDCGVFDTTLSKEFIIAQETFNLNKKDLHILSVNAIFGCFAEDLEKLFLKRTIDQYFRENSP